MTFSDGRTGVPYVDANMRELHATGFMSNRGRQVAIVGPLYNGIHYSSKFLYKKFYNVIL